MKNANDPIGKLIRVFMACGTQDQTTAPPHTFPSLTGCGNYAEVKGGEKNVENVVQNLSLNFFLIKTFS
jgi:hypothetical protein